MAHPTLFRALSLVILGDWGWKDESDILSFVYHLR